MLNSISALLPTAGLACPACNKSAQTSPACERCGCDLSQLHRIRAIAAASLNKACSCLRTQEWSDALRHAEASWQLYHSSQAAGVAFLAAGALGETAETLRWSESAS